jgi:polysaccharide biosynthesis/export protein VpsN
MFGMLSTSSFSSATEQTTRGMAGFASASVALRQALFAALTFWLPACSQALTSEYLQYAQMSFDASAFSTLGVGDVFEIRVFRHDNMNTEFTVPAAGPVSFPMIGPVEVLGHTCAEVEAEVTERLGASILRDPTVTCRLIELNSLAVIVSGEVTSPGRFRYTDSLTVIEAIALAQGASDNASLDRVVVTRNIDGVLTEIVVPVRLITAGRAPNFRLWPNDIVTVPTFRLIP